MRFHVEREVDQLWYPVGGGAIDANSPEQAVARSADIAGTYRVAGIESGNGRPALFRVPLWGPPEPIEAR